MPREFGYRNPFEAIFTPNRPGLLGIVGRAMGVPSDEEALMAKMGASQARGVQALQQSLAQGIDPQRALLDWINTPQGSEFFVSGGDLNDVINLVDATTPAAPEFTTMAPGTAFGTTDPRTGAFSQQGIIPTTELQNTTGMMEIANLTDDEKAGIARGMLSAEVTGDVSEQQLALDRLVKEGKITQETADAVMGGLIKIETDPVDGRTRVIDIGKMTSTDFTAGQSPAPGQPVESPSAEMLRGTGPTASVQSALGNIFGDLDPALAAEKISEYKAGIQAVHTAVITLRDASRLKADVDAVAKLVDPEGNSTPLALGQSWLKLHDFIDKREASNIEAISRGATKDIRADAEASLEAINGIRKVLPSREAILTQMETLRGEQGPAITAGQQVPGAISDAITSVLRGLGIGPGQPVAGSDQGTPAGEVEAEPESAAGQKFNSLSEVGTAVRAGRLKVGDVVIVNGKEVEIGPPKGKTSDK